MSGLGRPGVAAVKWSAASTLARFALQLLAQVVLARTLGPDIFGVFAIGMVVLTFATFVSGFGFSWSLLQRENLSDEDVRFAWTWQLIAGLATMLTVYLLAPLLALYFREPRAQTVIEWLSLACLLSAAAAPATYLLQRDLNFRAVGLVQVGSYAAGYVAVGLPMALMGQGEASLVAAWLVQSAVQFAASYALKPHVVRPLLWYADARTAVGTGRTVFFTNVVNWLLNNLDRVLIGRLLNAQALGLYNVAYNLATMPNTLLLGALQPAFLAAGARLQNDLPRLGRAYLQMLATVVVLGLPAFVTLAFVSRDIVRVLYGPAWSRRGLGAGHAVPVHAGLRHLGPVDAGAVEHRAQALRVLALQLPLVVIGAAGLLPAGRPGHPRGRSRGRRAAGAARGRHRHRGLSARWAFVQRPCCPIRFARVPAERAVHRRRVLAGQHATARFDIPLLSLVGRFALAADCAACAVAGVAAATAGPGNLRTW
jgi:lipopolysaccharide exporter